MKWSCVPQVVPVPQVESQIFLLGCKVFSCSPFETGLRKRDGSVNISQEQSRCSSFKPTLSKNVSPPLQKNLPL